MADGVDRTFAGCTVGRDADVQGIQSIAGSCGQTPASGTGRRGSARPREAHHPTLGARHGNIIPAVDRRFEKTGAAIVHQDPDRLSSRKGQLGAGGIDLRSVIFQRRIRHPERLGLVVSPRIASAAQTAIGVHRPPGGVPDEQVQVRACRVA